MREIGRDPNSYDDEQGDKQIPHEQTTRLNAGGMIEFQLYQTPTDKVRLQYPQLLRSAAPKKLEVTEPAVHSETKRRRVGPDGQTRKRKTAQPHQHTRSSFAQQGQNLVEARINPIKPIRQPAWVRPWATPPPGAAGRCDRFEESSI